MARKKKPLSKSSQKIQISVSVPETLIAHLDELASAENRNRSNYIVNELARLVEESEERLTTGLAAD